MSAMSSKGFSFSIAPTHMAGSEPAVVSVSPVWKEIFNYSADLASIIGLVVTLYIFWNIRNIKRYYLFIIRVPELLKTLTNLAGTVSTQLAGFPATKSDIILSLGKIEIILKSLKNKLKGDTKRSTKALIRKISTIQTTHLNITDVWNIYTDIQKLIIEINELQSDLRWGA